MIEEDLHVARDRARRWEELAERRHALAARIDAVRQALGNPGAWDQDAAAAQGSRLGALTADLAAVERELAEAGPVREVYEELLARQERRLVDSADPRGAELLEIGRLLAELDVELPARRAAERAGSGVVGGDPAGLQEFVRRLKALGLEPGAEAGWVEEVLTHLRERIGELGRMRSALRTRREQLLLEP